MTGRNKTQKEAIEIDPPPARGGDRHQRRRHAGTNGRARRRALGHDRRRARSSTRTAPNSTSRTSADTRRSIPRSGSPAVSGSAAALASLTRRPPKSSANSVAFPVRQFPGLPPVAIATRTIRKTTTRAQVQRAKVKGQSQVGDEITTHPRKGRFGARLATS